MEQDARRKKKLAVEEKEALELIAQYQRKQSNKATKGPKSSYSSASKAVSKTRASGKKTTPSPFALPPSMRGNTDKPPVSKRTGKPKVLRWVSDSDSDDDTDVEEPKKPVTPVKKSKVAKVTTKTKKTSIKKKAVEYEVPVHEWKCVKCTLVNAGKLLKCSACQKKPSQKCRLAGV